MTQQNALTITANGQMVTITVVFHNLGDYNRVQKRFWKIENRTAVTFPMHHTYLTDLMPQMLDIRIGNCVVVSAPAEIAEQYNLTVSELPEQTVTGFYELKSGKAKIAASGNFQVGDKIEGSTIAGFGKTWIEGGKAFKYAYFADYQSNRAESGVTYENGIQEWIG